MDKREFLQTCGALIAGAALSSGEEPASDRKNWAGNYTYRAPRLLRPKTVQEVQAAVKSSRKAKALGSRHSFNSIADSQQDQISLKLLDDMAIDKQAHTVTVGAGVTYGKLAPYLHENGFALHNLASLPHISVAGARSTATHGSGIKNGNLATPVSALELVTADGEIVTLSRAHDGERFRGAVVDLGGLGVVTKVTLDLQPTFDVSQVVYKNLSFSHLEHHLNEVFGSGYSVSLFTDWQNHRAGQVWVKRRLAAGEKHTFAPELFGAKLAARKLHPVEALSAESCTEQMGIPGPWYERLPHFRMNFTPSAGNELQSEYFVPRDRGYEAILAVEKLRDQITPHLLITELRTVAPDDLWMSTAYQRPSLAIHFTWKPEWDAVSKLLPLIEKQLEPFQARPHWAKVFTMSPARLESLYEKLPAYQDLAKQYDPTGKFRNDFLSRSLYA